MSDKKDHPPRNIIISAVISAILSGLISASISGCLIFNYQQNKIRQIEQEVKLAGKQQALFVSASVIPSKLYSAIWGVWYGVQGNVSKEEMTKRSDKLQTLFDEANTIRTELLLNFKNKNIGKDWENFMQKYHYAQYPITREGITEAELNKRLHEADTYKENMINNMYLEIKQR